MKLSNKERVMKIYIYKGIKTITTMKSDNFGLHSPLSDVSHHLSWWRLDGDLMSQGTDTGTPRAAGATLKLSNNPNHFLLDKRKIGLIIEQKLSYW